MQRYHVFRIWKWEILSVGVAFGLMTLIATLLQMNHGKPVPDWGKHFSFNATLAFLSTFLRATLVTIASKIISQRKWEWYREESQRPLYDLQQFDAGSGSTLGALLLLPVIRRDVVTLAAVIVFLASFLIGPFVRQASGTMELPLKLPGVSASLTFAHYVPCQGIQRNLETKHISGPASQDLVASVFSATLSAEEIENQINPVCITGNCIFSGEDGKDTQNITHSTVGICNKCVDISSLVYSSTDDLDITT